MAPKHSAQPIAQLEPGDKTLPLWYVLCRLREYLVISGEITVDNWNNSISAGRALAKDRESRHAIE